jgi:serine O-acetyltransferase
VIGPGVKIGEKCTIYQNVTIGAKDNGKGYFVPTIGNNVMIGCGSVLLGDIQIGNNVSIGANAVVIGDVDDNSIIVGNPGIIKKNRNSEE